MGKKYNIILADPPWNHEAWAGGGNRHPRHHYPVMDQEQILSLPIEKITSAACVLFLWTTWPHMPEALDVITAWGFIFKTCGFLWVKQNIKSDSLFMGLGSWTRANSEPCLLAIKGKMKRVSASVRQVVLSPRGEHSAKPPEVRERIVQLLGDLPRVELFARERVEGWDAMGNGIDGRDIRDELLDSVEL